VCGGAGPRRSHRGDGVHTRTSLPKEVDRQIRLWREIGQRALNTSRVAIVGLGGTGSACAVQLARLGVGELLLVDPQRSEPSNLNRLYGLTRTQASRGTPKVVVLRKRLREISAVKVSEREESVFDPGVIEDILDCDLVLGCTDSQNSRALLNELPTQYGLPFIDLGCAAESSGQEILSMWTDVRRIESGGPCLWCMGTLDPSVIAAEGLPPETRARAAKEGYVRGEGIEPSVINMTTVAASIGVAQVASRLMNQESVWPPQFLFDAWTGTIHRPRVSKLAACVCGSSRWQPVVATIDSIRRL
jgi:hypothetical protein